jgi:hypothetical protein
MIVPELEMKIRPAAGFMGIYDDIKVSGNFSSAASLSLKWEALAAPIVNPTSCRPAELVDQRKTTSQALVNGDAASTRPQAH